MVPPQVDIRSNLVFYPTWRLSQRGTHVDPHAEAVAHAVQNDRLPVRSVLQMLFSEHGKLNRLAELSGGASFGAPSLVFDLPGARCPPSARCSPSTMSSAASARTSPASRYGFITAISAATVQCSALQAQVDRLSMERRWHGGGGGFFKWSTFWFGGMSSDVARVEDSESGIERQTPASGKKGRGGALD
uniref:NPH3 domain-containing protein n=1 Tax=Oryza nivara TaxID=4536 RepID=A0A0E0FYN4_ORYNI